MAAPHGRRHIALEQLALTRLDDREADAPNAAPQEIHAEQTWLPLLGTARSLIVPTRPRLSNVTDSSHIDSSSRATGGGTFLISAGKSAAIFSSRSRSA